MLNFLQTLDKNVALYFPDVFTKPIASGYNFS